ncbi:MAG: copper chaperone PCu(A)C [Alphaproteobacteria bacterium]|nr:copper chaperone PCu(A)C [Alphaproteobacteria bacterium]
MKRFSSALFALALLLAPGAAGAHEVTAGPFEITHPHSRFTPKGAPNGVVYMVIENTGKEADRLIGASTPRAERAEIHETVQKGEVFSMRPREAVDLVPGDIVEFASGGLHLMLMKLTQPLVAGERYPLTLRFEKAGEFTFEVEVEGKDAAADDDGGHRGHHGD